MKPAIYIDLSFNSAEHSLLQTVRFDLSMGIELTKISLGAALAFGFLSLSAARAGDVAERSYTNHGYKWTGIYAGVNAGYSWGRGDTSFNALPDPILFGALASSTLSPNLEGGIGGGQIGFNWQVAKFVWGIESDIQTANVKGSTVQSPVITVGGVPGAPDSSISSSQRLTWFGTTRLRLGYTPIDRILFYATGGVSYGHVDYASNTSFVGGAVQYPAAFSKTLVGWTGGVGAEWAFVQNWSAKIEYLYIDLGKQSANGFPAIVSPFSVAYEWKTQQHIVRAGINYKF